MSLRLAALAILVAMIAPVALGPATHSGGSTYASQVASLIERWIEPLAPSNAPILKLLSEARTSSSLAKLLDALELDSDGDGVPNAFEYLDGLSPFAPRSFGYSDLAYFAGRIVVDGWLGDWKINGLCVARASPMIRGPRLAPVEEALYARQGSYLAVAIEFSKGFVYGNVSSKRFSLWIEAGRCRVEPVRSSQWGLGIEALFSFEKLFRCLNSSRAQLVLSISSGSSVERAVFSISPLSAPSIGPRCWRGFVEPLWARQRSVEHGLPVYYVVAYGDNRQPRWWSQVIYTSTTYRMFSEFREIDPIALVGTGDHVGAGLRAQIEEFLRATAFLANDWIVAGNHDWSYTRYADREFWYEYTVPDLYYRDVGEWRFVLLNGYALNQGLLREFVEVLNQSCAQHRYVVLVWHDPITYSHYDYPTDFSYWQMQSLRKVVREFRSCIKLMIFGHLHVFRVGTYDGIPYIITGGGGAPLSSPKYGLPIYHFVILELYPNGSFSYVPISIDDTSISVERIVPRPGVIEYEISNGATSINGTRVQLPMRVESFVRGIHLEVFLVAPPGYSRVVIDSNSRWINVSCSARRWFVYVWGLGALEPRNGVVSIGIPTGSVARARLGAVNGSIAIEGCSRCSAIATFRLEALGKSFRVSLEPTRVSRGLLEVDPSYVLNASAARIGVGSRVLAAVSNGAETKVLRAPLPLARPSIELRYLPSYVGKELSFELCLANASRIYILIDNSLAYSLRGFEGCRRVSLDISRYGEGPHLLKIVAISRSGARSVAVKPFVACWTPPSIEVPSVVRVSSLNQRIEIVARGVAPYTVVVKCLNTSVAKVFSSRGGESRFAVSPIELGIVSSGSYEIRIDVYDQVGHSVTKLVKLVVGTHRAATRVSTTRVSSSVPRASVLTASSTRATVSTSSTTMRTTSSAARWSGVGCWVWVAVAVVCAAAALAALARRRS